MSKIIRYQLSEIIPKLNAAAQLEPQSFASSETDDLFLCALGFEDRCLTLPSRLKEAGYSASRAIYFMYNTNLDDNASNLAELEKHLKGISTSVEPLSIDEADFSIKLRSLLDLVESEARSRSPKVTLDVSVTANRLLLSCINVLLEYDVDLRVIYAEAAVYHPTSEEYQANSAEWANNNLFGLERGVGDVRPSIDQPGQGLDPLPDSIILFPSFKAERSLAVISFVDPSLLSHTGDKIVWLLGTPHLETDLWRLDAMKKINAIDDNMRHCEVSTFDYREALRILESLYIELSKKYRITISPLGSKMQALGTALCCYMHPDVRIIFSSPKEYNAIQYSKGCKEIWNIDFGNTRDLRSNLDIVGTLAVED